MDLDRYVSNYGPDWQPGVLSEHVGLAVSDGHRLHQAPSGRLWIGPSGRGRAYPVVCSELIEIHTEDGPSVGRCGSPVADGVACAGHAAEMARWRNYAA